jgi:hypothetical protein
MRSNTLDVAGNRRDTHLYAMIKQDWLEHKRQQ